MKNLLKVFRGFSKLNISINFIFIVLWSLLYSYYNVLLAKSIEPVINGDTQGVVKFIILLFLYPVLWEITEFFGDTYTAYLEEKMENHVQQSYLSELYNIKPSILKNNNVGYISSLVNKYIWAKRAFFRTLLESVPISLVYICYYSVVMTRYNKLFGIILVGIVIIAAIIRTIGSRIIKPHLKALNESESQRDRLFVDSIVNINTVQKMQSYKFIDDKLKEYSNICIDKNKKHAKINELFFTSFKLITMLYMPICLLIYYSSPEAISGNIVELMSILTLVTIQIQHNMKSFGNVISDATRFIVTQNKLSKIINKENLREKIYGEKFDSAEIFDLSYTYRSKEYDKTLHIDIPYFEVKKGDKVCISGESGQGKTTLLNVLSQEIETDNVKINNIQTKERLDCVFIAQDTEVLDLSVRDNLKLGKDIPDEILLSYLDRVGLKGWIDSQENGLDTILGERGCYVSTGQRQRLNLIRGLLMTYSNKEIFLLDEPTSNVDEETEIKMVELINEVLADKTVIIVTHRPRIKDICNKHYEFIKGKLYSI